MRILEQREDLQVFKKLVAVFDEYSSQYPYTAFASFYKQILAKGIKSLPKDKKALEIFSFILDKATTSATKVNEIMNLRFSDLPVEVQPVFLATPAMQDVALWKKDENVYDRIISLFSIEETSSEGIWVNRAGKTITLIKEK